MCQKICAGVSTCAGFWRYDTGRCCLKGNSYPTYQYQSFDGNNIGSDSDYGSYYTMENCDEMRGTGVAGIQLLYFCSCKTLMKNTILFVGRGSPIILLSKATEGKFDGILTMLKKMPKGKLMGFSDVKKKHQREN